MSSTSDGRAGLIEELRRRRTALGWTLEQVAQQAQVSVGMLSLIETGKRRPSLRSWERIREALGISEPLPEEAWRQRPREISNELVAALGACLAAVRQATLAELAAATGVRSQTRGWRCAGWPSSWSPWACRSWTTAVTSSWRPSSAFMTRSPSWSSPSDSRS